MARIEWFKRRKPFHGFRPKKRRLPYWIRRLGWKLGVLAFMALVIFVGHFLERAGSFGRLPGLGGASNVASATGTISGIAYAIDGDTIRIDGRTKIRLSGVAAPEKNERGGYEATDFMKRLINGKSVRCELDGTRTYDRAVGICFLGGRDIGEAVIAAGLARDCPRYSHGRYRAVEPPGAASLAFPPYCNDQ